MGSTIISLTMRSFSYHKKYFEHILSVVKGKLRGVVEQRSHAHFCQ